MIPAIVLLLLVVGGEVVPVLVTRCSEENKLSDTSTDVVGLRVCRDGEIRVSLGPSVTDAKLVLGVIVLDRASPVDVKVVPTFALDNNTEFELGASVGEVKLVLGVIGLDGTPWLLSVDVGIVPALVLDSDTDIELRPSVDEVKVLGVTVLDGAPCVLSVDRGAVPLFAFDDDFEIGLASEVDPVTGSSKED